MDFEQYKNLVQWTNFAHCKFFRYFESKDRLKNSSDCSESCDGDAFIVLNWQS